jgi:FtsH-binding integral membrane protein
MAANAKHAKNQAQESSILDAVPDLKGNKDRKQFVIKVYALISAMLACTSVWTMITFNSPSLLIWIYSNLWLYFVCLIVTLGTMIGMTCYYKKCRGTP